MWQQSNGSLMQKKKETNSYEHKVKAEQIINSIYFVEIKLKDGTVYQAERQVKIDKQKTYYL